MSPTARLSIAALIACGMTGVLYVAGPPPAHTGGFGEETCAYCHFDGPLDDPAGSLSLEGVPEDYRPGKRYEIQVVLSHPELKRGGFQLAARYAGGSAAGRQAGTFIYPSHRIETDTLNGIVYVHHTLAGSSPDTAGFIRWKLGWMAPDSTGAGVVFHAAANAANGDDSEFGDFIYTTEMAATAR